MRLEPSDILRDLRKVFDYAGMPKGEKERNKWHRNCCEARRHLYEMNAQDLLDTLPCILEDFILLQKEKRLVGTELDELNRVLLFLCGPMPRLGIDESWRPKASTLGGSAEEYEKFLEEYFSQESIAERKAQQAIHHKMMVHTFHLFDKQHARCLVRWLELVTSWGGGVDIETARQAAQYWRDRARKKAK